jgi:hypothetical protein
MASTAKGNRPLLILCGRSDLERLGQLLSFPIITPETALLIPTEDCHCEAQRAVAIRVLIRKITFGCFFLQFFFPDWDVVKNFERVCRHIDVEARSRCPGI